MPMGTNSGNDTAIQKMHDLLETQRMLKTLIQHYTYSLNNHEEIMERVNKELNAALSNVKSAQNDYDNAPQQIVALTNQLNDVVSKYQTIKDSSTGKTQRINKFKVLRARLAALQKELEDEGVDIDTGLMNDNL